MDHVQVAVVIHIPHHDISPREVTRDDSLEREGFKGSIAKAVVQKQEQFAFIVTDDVQKPIVVEIPDLERL